MSPSAELVVSVSEFVALLNATLDYAYPYIIVAGELANFRVSKGKWLYFDLKDDVASVKFFGTVYQLPGPLEDGMLLEVRGQPQLHPLYGFSINVQSIRPVGEGSIKRAASLLQAKLTAEGLFDESRKRALPYPPQRIGLIASSESAAYSDFMKVLQHRWRGIEIQFIDVQVQGEQAVPQVVQAIEHFNEMANPPEVLIITRGGGSADDLQAFSSEQITRAVAGSRTPTIVAIGHERDVSLAELAADRRASTPSNAAELLTPDRQHELLNIRERSIQLSSMAQRHVRLLQEDVGISQTSLQKLVVGVLEDHKHQIKQRQKLLELLNPQLVLRRGYTVLRDAAGHNIHSVRLLGKGQAITLELSDGRASATIDGVE